MSPPFSAVNNLLGGGQPQVAITSCKLGEPNIPVPSLKTTCWFSGKEKWNDPYKPSPRVSFIRESLDSFRTPWVKNGKQITTKLWNVSLKREALRTALLFLFSKKCAASVDSTLFLGPRDEGLLRSTAFEFRPVLDFCSRFIPSVRFSPHRFRTKSTSPMVALMKSQMVPSISHHPILPPSIPCFPFLGTPRNRFLPSHQAEKEGGTEPTSPCLVPRFCRQTNKNRPNTQNPLRFGPKNKPAPNKKNRLPCGTRPIRPMRRPGDGFGDEPRLDSSAGLPGAHGGRLGAAALGRRQGRRRGVAARRRARSALAPRGRVE